MKHCLGAPKPKCGRGAKGREYRSNVIADADPASDYSDEHIDAMLHEIAGLVSRILSVRGLRDGVSDLSVRSSETAGALRQGSFKSSPDLWADKAIQRTGRFLKIHSVQERIGLSRATIYRLMKSPELPFPRPIKIVEASLWVESEVADWQMRYASSNRVMEQD